jgi:putative tryptophan/tyrosine transport system substrate-binding protein
MKGQKPADIPFQPLTKKQICVNQAAAAQQGLTLPPSLLKHADTIIQ